MDDGGDDDDDDVIRYCFQISLIECGRTRSRGSGTRASIDC